MKMQHSFFVVLVVGALLSSGVEGLQCYNCTNCADNFQDKTKTCEDVNIPVAGILVKCMKVNVGSGFLVSRSCSASPINGCMSVDLGGVTTTTCLCDTDFCNTSSQIQGSVLIASVLSIIVAKFFM